MCLFSKVAKSPTVYHSTLMGSFFLKRGSYDFHLWLGVNATRDFPSTVLLHQAIQSKILFSYKTQFAVCFRKGVCAKTD